MSKILAYLRTSPDKQDLMCQRLELLEYTRQQHINFYGRFEFAGLPPLINIASIIQGILDRVIST